MTKTKHLFLSKVFPMLIYLISF